MPVAYGKVPYDILGAGEGIRAMLAHPKDGLVYVAIAIHVGGGDMTGYPSRATLAEITGMSESSVVRAVRRLMALGLVAVEGKGGRKRSSRYTLLAEAPKPSHPMSDRVLPETQSSPGWPGLDQKPGHLDAKPGHIDTETRSPPGERRTAEQRTTSADAGASASAPTANAARSRTSQRSSIQWSAETGFVGITDDDRSRWSAAYPACDIDRQLASMDVWLRENPAKAHKSRWGRFIANWLSKSQDRGGDLHHEHRTNDSAASIRRAAKLGRETPEPTRALPTAPRRR